MYLVLVAHLSSAAFQVWNSCMWLVVTVTLLDQIDIEHFHHCGKFCWVGHIEPIHEDFYLGICLSEGGITCYLHFLKSVRQCLTSQ